MIPREKNPEILNNFLDYCSVLNKSKNTIKEYNYDIAHFLQFIKHHLKLSNQEDIKEIDITDVDINLLSRITENDINAFLSYLRQTYSYKAASMARKSVSLRTFFKYLCNKTKQIPNNPASELESPKVGKRLPKYLTLEESKKLLETSSMPQPDSHGNHDNSIRDSAIITLFLNCGMRLSELTSINMNNIDFENCKLTVIGKGDKERTIYLNKACIRAIKSYLEVRPHDGVKQDSRNALFLSEQRKRISNRTVQYIVKTQLRLAGLDTTKYSTHKLRHTAATLMYQYGAVDIRAIQEVLGHESISTTEIYTHVDQEHIRNAFESNPLADE